MLDPRSALKHARIYQAYQTLGGFFGARLRSMQRHLPIEDGSAIVDVGCGPGYLRRYLPANCRYIGYDTDAGYIDFAKRNHCVPGTEFRLGLFDAAAAGNVAPVDLVMFNGLLHHLTDDEARGVIRLALDGLRPGGRIFALDGCYLEGQGWFRKLLLDTDRGKFVRSPEAYLRLFPHDAAAVEAFIGENLSWVPYSWAVHVATKQSGELANLS